MEQQSVDTADVESQSTFEGNQAVFIAGMNMAKKARELLEAELGRTVVLRPSQIPHAHPLLAASRKWLERVGVGMAVARHRAVGRGTLLSVAPNMNREHRLYPPGFVDGPEFFALVPRVLPGDTNRVESAATHCGDRFAEVRFEDYAPVGDITTMVSTHTLYYLDLKPLVELHARLLGGASYHVVNHHIGAFGCRPMAESRWYLDTTGEVVERVRGNSHSYRHKPLSWVDRGGIAVGPGLALTARRIQTMFDTTSLVELRLEQTQAFHHLAREASLFDYLSGQDLPADAGWREFHESDAVAVRAQINRFLVVGDAAVLELGSEHELVVLDRRLVNTVSSLMTGQPRTAEAERDALYYSRRELMRSDFLAVTPHLDMERVVTVMAAVALYRSIHANTATMLTTQEVFGPITRVYNTALQWAPVFRYRWWQLAVALVAVVAAFALSFTYLPYEHHAAAWTVAGAAVLAGTVMACTLRVFNVHLSERGRSWTRWAFLGQPTSVNAPLPLLQPLLPGHQLVRGIDPDAMRELNDDNYMELGDDPHPRAHPSRTLPRSEVVGMQPVDVVPLVIEGSQEADASGVANRILAKTPIISPEMLDLVVLVLEQNPKLEQLRALAGPPPSDVEERWLARCPSEADRRDMLKARASLKQRALCKADLVKVAHMKAEKTRKTVDRANGQVEAKPRIIQALTDRFKMFVSPQVWWACQRVKKCFDGACGLLFASGRTAEQVGENFRKTHQSFSDPVFFINDHSEYDASCGEGFKLMVWGVLSWLGVAFGVIKAIISSLPVGITSHGVSYATVSGLCSGSPETSDFGSLWNAITMAVVFLRLAIADEAWAATVLGDDGTGIIDWTPDVAAAFPGGPDELAARMNQLYADVGLKSNVFCTRSLSKFQFASYLVYPVVAGKHVHWVMGPKAGRALTKLATKRIDARSSNLAADVASLWQDGAHVPFLRVVLSRYREILKGVKPKGRPSDEDHKIRTSRMHTFADEGWTMIYERYGLQRADEEDLAGYLKTVVSLPCVIEHRVISRLVEVDF